jgi:hypothetical protein
LLFLHILKESVNANCKDELIPLVSRQIDGVSGLAPPKRPNTFMFIKTSQPTAVNVVAVSSHIDDGKYESRGFQSYGFCDQDLVINGSTGHQTCFHHGNQRRDLCDLGADVDILKTDKSSIIYLLKRSAVNRSCEDVAIVLEKKTMNEKSGFVFNRIPDRLLFEKVE